ncbi:unnamed protein product [Paramecium octaurelia]|uniref:Phosphatidylserine synthase n=1 Tax=Paramecium octaurelia TaxID=43137 RepID=A0A8S1T618_PAROT|nr:unnamed protein product [Paramecium octaurelia]
MRYQEQILFFISACTLIYFAYENGYDNIKNRYRGVQGGIIFICMMGSLKSYDGPIKRFQGFWRFMFWLGVCYNAFLIFLIFQNESEARQLMKLGDDSLGRSVTKDMHTYDDNCEFELVNIVDNLDHYFLLHCLNWFLLAFLLRDAWLLNFWQIFDEVIELSWQHILPHFRECWWDHVLLDVLIGNTLFVFLGLWVSKKLGIEQFDWLGRKDKSFTQWLVWHDYKYFAAAFGTWLAVTINFLTGFFLMNQLWVPPKCWMVSYRLFVWFGMGVLSWQEQWNDLKGNQDQSGQCRYLVVWTLFAETFISIKFLKDAGNIQYVDTPYYISIPWIATMVISSVVYLIMRVKNKRVQRVKVK